MADWYERGKAKQKERYRELKSKGICTRCRKEKAAAGFTECEACKEKSRKEVQLYKRNGYNTIPFNNKTTDTLKGIYEEVTKYNEEHGTNYSYGYYKALKFRGLI